MLAESILSLMSSKTHVLNSLDFLSFWQVTFKEELREQEKIASIHDHGGRVVFAVNSTNVAVLQVSHLLEVQTRQSDGNTTNHLQDLTRGNKHRVEPTRLWLYCDQEIVEIHARMNGIIHDDKKETRRRHGHVRMPAVQQDSDVVIPVQEDEGLFVNDNKECIN